MKVAQHVHHPGNLNSAGEPEIIIAAGETLEVWHLDAIRDAGIERVVVQVHINVENLKVDGDISVYTLNTPEGR